MAYSVGVSMFIDAMYVLAAVYGIVVIAWFWATKEKM